MNDSRNIFDTVLEGSEFVAPSCVSITFERLADTSDWSLERVVKDVIRTLQWQFDAAAELHNKRRGVMDDEVWSEGYNDDRSVYSARVDFDMKENGLQFELRFYLWAGEDDIGQPILDFEAHPYLVTSMYGRDRFLRGIFTEYGANLIFRLMVLATRGASIISFDFGDEGYVPSDPIYKTIVENSAARSYNYLPDVFRTSPDYYHGKLLKWRRFDAVNGMDEASNVYYQRPSSYPFYVNSPSDPSPSKKRRRYG